MKFWKMNGAGNDFIILNNLEEHLPLEAIPQIARTLCRRRMSIGADGLMVVEAADQGGVIYAYGQGGRTYLYQENADPADFRLGPAFFGLPEYAEWR